MPRKTTKPKKEKIIPQVKCAHCKEKSEKEIMKLVERQPNKIVYREYFHEECYVKYLEEKEFKKKELEEMTYLVEDVIKKVHKQEVVPTAFFSYLQQLRNGDIMFGKIKKQYKEGFPFPLIAETYKRHYKEVRRAVAWKKKNGGLKTLLSEFVYGLGVVKSKLQDTRDKLKQEAQAKIIKIEQEKERKELREVDNYVPEDLREIPKFQKPKKKDENDISFLL